MTRISKSNAQKLKISPTKIILNSANNMNNVQSEKYGLSPQEIFLKNHYLVIDLEQFLICTGQRKQSYFMIDLKGTIKKKYKAKRRKLREDLNIEENILVLAERIKKTSAPWKFYK